MTDTDRPKRLALARRLDFRLGVGLCVGAALILAAAGTINIHLQRERLTALVSESGARSVAIIRRSLRDAMLRNRPAELHNHLDTIGAQEGILRLRIFDRSGRVRVSTDREEEATLARAESRSCAICHATDPPGDDVSCMETSRIFENADGRRVLAVLAPIVNEPDCSTAACHAHPPDTYLLGVLDAQLSLESVDAQIASSERQIAFALLLTAGGVALLAGFLVWRMVIRPVAELTRGTKRVAAGDLTTQVCVRTPDEIGELAHAWNRMVGELARARRELEEWSTTLEQRVEEKTAELESAHQTVLLSARMASLGKLAAVVAHEINNPLAGINTFARLLKRKIARANGPCAADGEMAKVLGLIASEADRCGEIVRNLLLFSRVPAARFAEEDLAELLERCVMLVKHRAEMQEIFLELDVAPNLPRIFCDVSHLQQLVLALAMNAIEAMPDGGTLAIAAHLAEQPGEVELTVSDTGCGIDPRDLDRIFEPFFTHKEEGRGVGLGLAVVYGVIKRHRGRIDVESKPGLGTKFCIHLPVRPPRAAGTPPGVEEVTP